jgi:hypothetical protein
LAKATKGQIDIACLKAKIHLELCRDRKNSEIIKGEKELVNKLRGKSRNKVEEILIAERVVNGLKYAQGNLIAIQLATCSYLALPLSEDTPSSLPITRISLIRCSLGFHSSTPSSMAQIISVSVPLMSSKQS